jgi:site-specific DNA recombinase
MKNLIFCRVSSREQEETGYSLDAQEQLLKDYSNKKQFKIIKTFRVSESASGKQVRKLFNELFEYATKKKINIICCEKIDRLTRNPKDAALVQDWINEDKTREIHFVKESFVLNSNTRAHENLVWDMKVAIARFYTNNLSEEVKKGQKAKLSQGWLPLKPPLGYKTIGEKGHKTHIIDEEKAPFIRKAFELYSTGNYSIRALSEIMHKEGLRNDQNKRVSKSRLYDHLSNPFYYGKIKWNEKILQGSQEPIISKELFDLVQSKLNRKFKSPSYTKHFPVFRSKVRCAECGGTITWEIQKGHWYGHCNHYRNCSQKKWLRQEKFEDMLLPILDKLAPKSERILKIIEKALKESHAEEIKYNENATRSLNNIIETSQRRLEKIYEDKIDGTITQEFYSKKFKEYTEQKEDAIEKLKKLNEDNKRYYQTGFALHELALKAKEIYKNPKTTTEDKRLLLSKIFSNLTLDDRGIKANLTPAFEFIAEWTPILNNTFEPANFGLNKGKEGTLMPSCSEMLRW